MPFDRKGPLPLPNRFLCYTRPSRGYSFAPPTRPISFTHPPDQSGHDYLFSIWSSNEKRFVILHHLKKEGAGFYLANYRFGGKMGLIFDASLPENLIKKNNLPGFSCICWPHFRSVCGHDVVQLKFFPDICFYNRIFLRIKEFANTTALSKTD